MKVSGFLAACAALLALSGCGGGTQIDPFHPTRVIAFGDDYSAFKDQHKYTVNALTAATDTPPSTNVCSSNALWVQSVAGSFGLSFQDCPGGDPSKATGIDLAAFGARVADVVNQQIPQFKATHSGTAGFSHSDLVTIMVGTYDVIDAADQGANRDTAIGIVQQRAVQLAHAINDIAANDNAPVLVLGIPDVSLTPYAQAKGADYIALTADLTVEFNTTLQLNLINDGHLIGLAQVSGEIQNMVKFPSAYGLTNVTDPVCSNVTRTSLESATQLLSCTTDGTTLVTDPGTGLPVSWSAYLWAGPLQMTATGQGRLGYIASLVATRNPF
jgi:phospholipase/lecithinase/hemolysin